MGFLDHFKKPKADAVTPEMLAQIEANTHKLAERDFHSGELQRTNDMTDDYLNGSYA